MQRLVKWLTDKATWIVLFTAITAVSSTYGAYKIHKMAEKAEVKVAPAATAKAKR
jgi:hypothetical protein